MLIRLAFQKTRHAFTLIELLIVVAIIAILAAIAIPNFIQAQTRAKVSRVEAELRLLSLAIETYHIDNGCYPRQGATNTCAIATSGLPELLAPIAYLTSYPNDLFRQQDGQYLPLQYGTCTSGSMYYYIWSVGPDLVDQYAQIIYDPTNGTISTGDIKRTTAREILTTSPQP